jgi:hypothetical protein
MSLTAGTLYLSSYNNADNDTATNFYLTLSVPVNRAKRIRVLASTLANLMMPFGYNDKLWEFTVNGTIYVMNFDTTIRWATMDSFLTYVNTVLFPAASPSAVPSRLQLFYNTDKNQLYLKSTTNTDVIEMPGWNWNNRSGTAVAYNANYRLGWTSPNSVFSTGGILYADGFPNVFQRTNVIYITSNLSTDSNNDANIANIIGRFPVNVPWGGIVYYENVHSDFASPIFTENIKNIHILLLDQDYQPLVNPGNAYFELQVGIEY